MVTSLVIRKQWCRKKPGVSIKYMDSFSVDMTFISIRDNIFLCDCMIILAVSTNDIRQ